MSIQSQLYFMIRPMRKGSLLAALTILGLAGTACNRGLPLNGSNQSSYEGDEASEDASQKTPETDPNGTSSEQASTGRFGVTPPPVQLGNDNSGACLVTDEAISKVFSCRDGVPFANCLGSPGRGQVYYFVPSTCDASKKFVSQQAVANKKATEEFDSKKGACIILNNGSLTSCVDNATHVSCHCPDGDANSPYGCVAKQTDPSDWRKVVYGKTCAEVKSEWFSGANASAGVQSSPASTQTEPEGEPSSPLWYQNESYGEPTSSF